MPRTLMNAIVAIAVAAAAAGVARAAVEKDPFGSLTVEEVAAGIKAKSLHLYDCNPNDMWKRGHVPGAKWVAYQNLTAGDLPDDKDAKLVFYCANEH